MKDMYTGLTSRVKWLGELSDSFRILQGVRQGGLGKEVGQGDFYVSNNAFMS